MISVPFELEQVEFGMLIPVIPLPEKFQKECSLTQTFVTLELEEISRNGKWQSCLFEK